MNEIHGQGEITAQRYQIVTVLGQGGMGITYGAIDLKNNQKIALKVVSLNTK
jgi:eukaryotic-like serine/threonine-protein kinase